MLDQNQTQQLLALVQRLLAQQQQRGGTRTPPIGLPGLSGGGLGGWGEPGDYGPSGPGVGAGLGSSVGLGAPSLGPSINDPYGDPLNAYAGLAISALGMAPGPVGAIGRGLGMGYGLGNQFGMFGQMPRGPQWLEKMKPLSMLPVVGPFVGLGVAAGRAFAPQSLATLIDDALTDKGFDPSSMPETPTQDLEKSLALEVSFANPEPVGMPEPAFTGWVDEPGFIGTAPATEPGTGITSTDIDEFVDDFEFSDVDIDDFTDGMGDFGGVDDDLSDGGMGGEGTDDGSAGDDSSGGSGDDSGGDDDSGDGDW